MSIKFNYYLGLFPFIISACTSGSTEVPSDKEIRVKLETVIPYNGDCEVSYSGVVEPKTMTPLSFSSMGTVSEVYAEEGQEVRKGQLLARINDANAENMLQLALQKLAQAQDAYDRLKPMKENGTLPEIKWVEVEVGLNQAKSSVAIARKGVKDCTLYAPENGVIGKKYILPGMNVLPGASAFELVDISSVFVKIPVPENEVSAFRKGEESVVSIAAISGRVNGSVKEIGVSADILSHTYPVKIEVQNKGKAIKPGMICAVSVTHTIAGGGMLLPAKSLMQDSEGNQFVFVCYGKKVVKRKVRTIAFTEENVVVSGEIDPKDAIVVSGQQKLYSGAFVHVIR